MTNLRKDELLDRNSYLHKILAQKYAIKADTFRHSAYAINSTVNGLFAKALKLKQRAYSLESRTDDSKSPSWKKIYQLKRDAFLLETKANTLKSRYYKLKKLFYTHAEKEAMEYAKFTKLKAKNYATKIRTNVPGECGSKNTKKASD